MGAQSRSSEMLQQIYEAWIEANQNAAQAARSLGIPASTFKEALSECKAKGMHLSDGARSAVQSAGLSGLEAKAGWIVNVDPETGSRQSTYWRAPDTPVEDILDRIKSAFDGITPASPAIAPAAVMADLCTVYPIFDMHLGMLAWADETGAQDYDTRIAADDVRYAFAKIAALTPASDTAIVLIGGDFFHADTDEAVTKRSRHSLDVDGRIFKVLDLGIQLVAETVEALLHKHENVIVRVLRGNHDEDSHRVLSFSLAERYRQESRITVEKNPRDLFMKQWGRCLIAAHHGDKAKPERLTLYLSDVCEFWSATRHRYCFTGHIHHDQARDTGPLRWESLRAFCPPDAYASGMGYATRRALQSLTFHKADGLVLRAIDPIERQTK
jgi:hypothetical protein